MGLSLAPTSARRKPEVLQLPANRQSHHSSVVNETAQFQGRAAASNPPNRLEQFHLQPDLDAEGVQTQEAQPAPATQFFKDHSTFILTWGLGGRAKGPPD